MSDRKPVTREQARAFLAEYLALCRKHQIALDACSCCNGVNLRGMETIAGVTANYEDGGADWVEIRGEMPSRPVLENEIVET